MSTLTTFLSLLKKNPETDGSDTFNIQTMLNENWDKIDGAVGDISTPAQKMGLTGNLSVGAALGVLADVGNVHVWKKSTLISNEMQAGYSLGAVKNGTFFVTPVNAVNSTGNWDYADSITVNFEGEYTLVNSENINYRGTNTYLKYWENLKGKFARHNSGARDFAENTLYFIPENATIAYDNTQFSTYTNKYQEVNLRKHIPAKYEVTFLTSTDPNAYQEGAAGNSTIEYLGTLGDRARIEVGSYVGTGYTEKRTPIH